LTVALQLGSARCRQVDPAAIGEADQVHEYVGHFLSEVGAVGVSPPWQARRAGRVAAPLKALAQLSDFTRERERE